MSTKRKGVPEYDKAGLDEPIFVMRAQDAIAPEITELWALALSMRGSSDNPKIASARQCAREMRAWQDLHGCKMPD